MIFHLQAPLLGKIWLEHQTRMQKTLTLIYSVCWLIDLSNQVLMKRDHLWKSICTRGYNQRQHEFYLYLHYILPDMVRTKFTLRWCAVTFPYMPLDQQFNYEALVTSEKFCIPYKSFLRWLHAFYCWNSIVRKNFLFNGSESG